jgi:hypothetical protein
MVKAKKKVGPKAKIPEEDDGDWEALLEAEGVTAANADEKAHTAVEAQEATAGDLSEPTLTEAGVELSSSAQKTAPSTDAAAAFLAAQGITVGGGDNDDKKDNKKKKKKKPTGEKKQEEKPEKVCYCATLEICSRILVSTYLLCSKLVYPIAPFSFMVT